MKAKEMRVYEPQFSLEENEINLLTEEEWLKQWA